MCALRVLAADLHPGNIFVCKQETQAGSWRLVCQPTGYPLCTDNLISNAIVPWACSPMLTLESVKSLQAGQAADAAALEAAAAGSGDQVLMQ